MQITQVKLVSLGVSIRDCIHMSKQKPVGLVYIGIRVGKRLLLINVILRIKVEFTFKDKQ